MGTSSVWTDSMDAVLREHGTEKTGTEIARMLGTTRNAVLGRALRKGISLRKPEGHPSHKAAGERLKSSKGRKGSTLPANHPARRSRLPSEHAFSLAQRAGAVAALMAGASYRAAAEIAGASKVTVRNLWRHDPEVIAAAKVIYDEAQRRIRIEAQARQQWLALQTEAVARHNDRILAGWGERNANIVRRKLAGETLSAIGADFGLTRERCRQILVRAIEQGLQSPPGINLQNDKRAV